MLSFFKQQLKIFLEPAMFCHLAVLIYLCGEVRQDKRPKVHAKQKRIQEFFLLLITKRAWIFSSDLLNSLKYLSKNAKT